GGVIGRFGDSIDFAVAGHGEEDAQQSSRHGDVGLGLFAAASGDDPLSGSLLGGVGSAQATGGFAQRPSQRAAAGLGDLAGGGAAGGLLVVGREAGPELQGVSVGEAAELADLRGDDASPDLADARHALQQVNQGGESFAAVGLNDTKAQRLHDAL